MTNTVQVYSFIDKCFPNFPNWIVQLNTNSQKYFQPKILNVLFRRHKGQLCSGAKEKLSNPTPDSGFGNLELQSQLFK